MQEKTFEGWLSRGQVLIHDWLKNFGGALDCERESYSPVPAGCRVAY